MSNSMLIYIFHANLISFCMILTCLISITFYSDVKKHLMYVFWCIYGASREVTDVMGLKVQYPALFDLS